MKPNTPDLADLARRLEKLERQNRRLRVWAAGALVLAGLVLVTQLAPVSQAQQDTKGTDKDRFAVRDKDGTERAWLGMGKDGPGLFLSSPEHKSRAEFTLGKAGMVLRLVGADGKMAAGLSVQPEGVAIAVKSRTDGKPLVGVDALRNDAGILFGDSDTSVPRRP